MRGTTRSIARDALVGLLAAVMIAGCGGSSATPSGRGGSASPGASDDAPAETTTPTEAAATEPAPTPPSEVAALEPREGYQAALELGSGGELETSGTFDGAAGAIAVACVGEGRVTVEAPRMLVEVQCAAEGTETRSQGRVGGQEPGEVTVQADEGVEWRVLVEARAEG